MGRSASSLRTAGLAAALILLFYLYLYPARGFHLAVGSDTPVYIWWARRTGQLGMRALQSGGRPAIVGLIATLASVTRRPDGAVVAAIGAVLAVAVSLAMASFVEIALAGDGEGEGEGEGRGPDGTRFVLTSVLTGTFLCLLVPGYFSTIAFGAMLVAALACLTETAPRSEGSSPRRDAFALLIASLLVGAAGLAHPLFLVLGAILLAGSTAALGPVVRAERAAGVPLARTSAASLVAAGAGGAAVALAGLVWIGPAAKASVDTSRDSVLRRVGLAALSRQSFQRVLHRFFPWYRSATVVGLAATAFVVRRRGGEPRPSGPRPRIFWGAMAAWVAATVVGVVALLAGLNAPGQRLAAFCLPLPVLAAIGLAATGRSTWPWPGRFRLVPLVGGAVLFVFVTWLFWSKQQPLVASGTAQELRYTGSALAAEPPGTPLIVVADDRTVTPGFSAPRTLNYLRDTVSADRIPDVHVFVGTPAGLLARGPALTGLPEHDRIAQSSWREIQPLLHGTPAPLALVLEDIDPQSYAAAFRLPEVAAHPSRYQLRRGVLALPGLSGSNASILVPPHDLPPILHGSGTASISPWLPVWLGPLLVLMLFAVGWPWVRATLPSSHGLVLLGLAPAFGMAAIGLISILVDATGLRLSDGGGVVAFVGAGLLGLAAMPFRTRRAAQRS